MRVWFLSQKGPLGKEVATLSSILAWRIPWSLADYSPWGHKESARTEQRDSLNQEVEKQSLGVSREEWWHGWNGHTGLPSPSPLSHPLWRFIRAAIFSASCHGEWCRAVNDVEPCSVMNEAAFSSNKGFWLLMALTVSILLPIHFFQM